MPECAGKSGPDACKIIIMEPTAAIRKGTRLRPMRRRELMKKLKKLGYEFDRPAKRHHEIWFNPITHKRLPIPNYDEFGVSLLGEICGELGVKPSDFMDL